MINDSADKYHHIVANNARIHNTKMKITSKRSNAHHKMIHEYIYIYINNGNRLNNRNIIQHKTKTTNKHNTKDDASIVHNSNNIKKKKNNHKKKTKHYNKDNETNDHISKIQKPKTHTTTQNNNDTQHIRRTLTRRRQHI